MDIREATRRTRYDDPIPPTSPSKSWTLGGEGVGVVAAVGTAMQIIEPFNREAVISTGIFAILVGVILTMFTWQTTPGYRGAIERSAAVLAAVLLVSGASAATLGFKMPGAAGKNSHPVQPSSSPASTPSPSPTAPSPTATPSTVVPTRTPPPTPAHLRLYRIVNDQFGTDLDGDGKGDLYRTSSTAKADQIQAFPAGTRPIRLLADDDPPGCAALNTRGSGNLKVPSLRAGDRICLRGTRAWIFISISELPAKRTLPLEIRAGVV